MASVWSGGFNAKRRESFRLAFAFFLLLACIAQQQCAGQNVPPGFTSYGFGTLELDYSDPGCLGQKKLGPSQCLAYESIRKYACCGVQPPQSSSYTPVCKYWSGSLLSAVVFASSKGLAAYRAQPPVPSSQTCGYNYKPLSQCARDCADYIAWHIKTSLPNFPCGSSSQCALNCGCSPYTGTPRNPLLSLWNSAFTATTTNILRSQSTITFTQAATTPASLVVSASCRRTPVGDCSWYRQCIEGHYPCSGTNFDVAVGFGERYCNHLSTFSVAFTDNGKRWISAVKICKQAKLYESVLFGSLSSGLAPAYTCSTLEGFVMDSFQQDCFIQPDSSKSTLSLCTVECRDILTMMAITLGTVPKGKSYLDASSYRTAIAVEGKILKDIGICLKNYRHKLQDLTCIKQLFKRVVKIALKNIPIPKTLKKIATNVLTEVGLRVASAVVEKLEDAFSWAKKGVQKFFSGNATSSSSFGRKRRSSDSLPTAVDVTVTIMLTTEARLNATITRTNTPSPDITSSPTANSDKIIDDAYNDVIQAIRTGSSVLRNIRVPASTAADSDSFTVTPSSLSECLDVACDATNPNVTNVSYPHSGCGNSSTSKIIMFILALVFVIFAFP